MERTTNNGMLSIFVAAFSSFVCCLTPALHAQVWQPVNGPLTPADCEPIAIGRGEVQYVFVGTYVDYYGSFGGVSRSIAGSGIWDTVGLQGNENVPNSGFLAALTIDASGTIYAGSLAGIYRSSNNGNSWNFLGLGSQSISAIAVTSSGTIFCGTYSEIGEYGEGIFRSVDSGQTWDTVSNGIDSSVYVTAFAIDAQNNIFVATFGDGIFKSTDQGNSWHLSFSNPNFYEANELFCVVVNSRGELFAGSQNGVFFSSDDGTTWVPKGLQTNIVADIPQVQSIAFDPFGNVYLSAAGMYRSTDDGTTWVPIDSGMVYVDNHQMESDSEGNLFVSCESNEGVWRSSDRGSHWLPNYAGLPNREEFGLCTDDSGILTYIGGVGFFRTTDDGNTWIPSGGLKNLSTPATNGTAVFTTGADGLILAAQDDGYSDGIYRATNYGKTYTPNYGQTWVRVDSELANILALALDEPGRAFACSEIGLYRSFDTGKTWEPPSNIGLGDSVLWSIAILKNKIFVGSTSGVFVSDDMGTTWKLSGLNSMQIVSMACDSNGDVFAGTSANGIFRTSDSGTSWVPSNQGLIDQYIAILTTLLNGTVVAASGPDVYLSSNDGSSWNPIFGGLNVDVNSYVDAVTMDKNGWVFASEGIGGVFRLSQPLSVQAQQALNFEAPACSPDPATNTINITFNSSSSPNGTIGIFDVLGNQVSPNTRFIGGGTISVPLSLEGISSGTYYVRIFSINGEVQESKFVKK